MNDLLNSELADLRLFADPFEAFTSVPRADGWMADFVRNGEDIAIQRESDGAIRTLAGPGQRKYRNFKGLLVSETFANLERLASAQRHRTAHLIDSSTGNLKEFLPVAGELRWSDGHDEPLTLDRVRELLEGAESRLHVFVVDGSAGVGKSHLIERIVRSRAEPASYKSGKPLLLHVESRGKVLTSLNDRIAGTLSSLRASFFEEELKPLIRRGAVQLAIDGFDELSDSRGYIRAWGALRDFIRDLKGEGTCILAGRDTMLDLATVREGLGNVVRDDAIIFLRIQYPPAREIRVWLSNREEWRDQKSALNALERRIENSEYLRRPFFISIIANLGPDYFQDVQGEPIAELMETIVRREGEKLTGVSADIDTELVIKLYGEVLSEVARMMMDDETNEIEIDLVELLLEEVFTGNANSEMVRALAQRAKALALLEEEIGDSNKRSFPHETIRSYFFGQSIFDHFPVYGATTGLHRSPLSADDFRIFNRVARRKSLNDQRRLRECLLAKLREPGGYDYLRSNIGGLLLSFAPLDEDGIEDDVLVLSHLQLRDVWMADLLGTQKISLDGCHIFRLDVRGADLGEVRFSNTEIFELLTDPFVKFGTSIPVVRSIILYEHFKETRLFEGVSDWIAQRSCIDKCSDAEPDKIWHLLQQFARITLRQSRILIYERAPRGSESIPKIFTNDWASRMITTSPLWPELLTLLKKYDRLHVSVGNQKSVHVRGRNHRNVRVTSYHLDGPEEFLHPTSLSQPSTRRILEELNVHLYMDV